MNIDFSLVLLVLSALTGVVWLFDVIFLAGKRRQKVAAFLAGRSISTDEFTTFVDSLDEAVTVALATQPSANFVD